MSRLLVIVDLDGTLYDNTHREHLIPEDRSDTAAWVPFNAACSDDEIRPDMASLVRTLLLSEAKVIFLTGRGAIARKPTLTRLQQDLGVPGEKSLFMREMDDYRPAHEFKVAWVRAFIKAYKGYQVIALEDDPAIIEAFRVEGITTLQIDSLCADVRTKYAQ